MGKNRKSGEIRESKDLAEKELESFPDVAADLINVLLYNGEQVVHKEAVIRMIRALAGERNPEDTAKIMEQCEIREEDEITVCELFDQYWRGGLQEGLQKGLQKGHEEGRIEGRDTTLLSSIRALMENLSLTAEQALKALNVSESEQEGYLARL